jgi:Glutathione-dependent formaldehyde-activating enzyme
MTQKLSGGCACGAIHYDCNANPVIMFNCHCRDCQRASGSAYAAIVVVPKAAVQMRGEPRYHKIVGGAGKAMERGFCPTLRQPRDRQIGTAAQHPRIASGKLGRPINVPTHDGRIYLKRAALGSHGPQGPKAHARAAVKRNFGWSREC